MAKKKGGLSHIYPKDRRCFSIMAKTGSMSKDTFHQLEISDNRIKTYKQNGLIREVSVPDRHGNGVKTFYELTSKKGKDFCRQECNVKDFISNGNASVHNAKVSEYLANNLTKNELSTVMSERELHPFIEDRLQEYWDKQEYDHYNELLEALNNNQLSMPDVIYKSESNPGMIIAIEVITDNYGNEEISAKLETAELLGIEIQIVEA